MREKINRRIRPGLALGAIALAIAVVALVNVHATGITGAQWTQVGPAPLQIDAGLWQRHQGSGPDSGEVVDIAIDPRGSTDQTIYIASGSGGIWKSTDHGTSWRPLTDSLLSLQTGAVALDPGNPSIVYAGTGNPAYVGNCRSCTLSDSWYLQVVGRREYLDAAAEQPHWRRDQPDSPSKAWSITGCHYRRPLSVARRRRPFFAAYRFGVARQRDQRHSPRDTEPEYYGARVDLWTGNLRLEF
jgi:hypothetical protein